MTATVVAHFDRGIAKKMLNIQIIISVSFLIGGSVAAVVSREENEEKPNELLGDVVQHLQKVENILHELPSPFKASDEEETDEKVKKIVKLLDGTDDILTYEFPKSGKTHRVSVNEEKVEKITKLLQRLEKTADQTDDFLYKRTTTTERSNRETVKAVLGIVAQALSAAG